MRQFDVYAYGVIASSTLHLIRTPFPPADGYAELARTYQMTGGEAANSSIVLSRLGQRVKLDGNWLGDTVEGKDLLAILESFHIDISRLRVKAGYAGVREIVISDEGSRTIFGTYGDLLSGTRQWNLPCKSDVAQAHIVCVDPPFQEASAMVGRYASEAEVPYVTIDCPPTQALARRAAAVIISGEFRDREYPQANLADLFKEYQANAAGLVIFTCGSRELLYGRKGETIQCYQPYPVKTIDPAGAGDAFRAGVVLGLRKGWDDEKTIRYAAALAGLICMTFPGVLRCPTHRAVLKFIREHGR